jgi:maltooligosyltrehalose trehalohydrolase
MNHQDHIEGPPAGHFTEIGARFAGGKTSFTLWAPHRREAALRLEESPSAVPMEKDPWGYWRILLEAGPATRYRFVLDGEVAHPDPASHCQPEGVHGPSAVVDHSSFPWTDRRWKNVPLSDYVIYELHVGTFSPASTFEAVMPRLPDIADLGVTALEIMPVAAFPGARNWGYDGVFPFAVQESYGGPDGLKRLVNACHAAGLAVILDVVYNHLGPEGNCFSAFGPYFTGAYATFWGEALNFDGEWSFGVRNFVLRNALHWFENYHMDGLRLDAVHAIFDRSATHILQELAETADACGAATGVPRYLIAESDLNDPRIVRSRGENGYGVHSQWSDEFHHALHAVLTGERRSYYADFGDLSQLGEVYERGFFHARRYSAFRKRLFGADPSGLDGGRFVVCTQNHDQVGNRPDGRRLSGLVSFEALKLAAAALLVSPFIPLLFMGEEYGETAPFLYFVDHSDPALIDAVREGRRREFEAFGSTELYPDPAVEETFRRSVLRWELRERGTHRMLRRFYRTLIGLRRDVPVLRSRNRDGLQSLTEGDLLILTRDHPEGSLLVAMNFGKEEERWTGETPAGSKGPWRKLLCSSHRDYGGPGDTTPEMIGDAHPGPRGRDRERASSVEYGFITLAPESAVLFLTE